jgi:hypothetical protein
LDEKSDNDFFFQIQVLLMIRNETEVLNLKTRKTQVPLGYLTLNFITSLLCRYKGIVRTYLAQLTKTSAIAVA